MIEFAANDLRHYGWSFALALPRVAGLMLMLPVFNRQVIGALPRQGVVLAMALPVVPWLAADGAGRDWDAVSLALILVKEAFIGVVLGFFVAIPFWIFDAVGFVIDNQRGAALASVINPGVGNDSSPLGILLMQGFTILFLITGGLNQVLSMLYDSYRLWNPWTWRPGLDAQAGLLMLEQLSRYARLVLVYSGPAVVVMLLSEVGLGLVGRFAPQLQVFILAMPIKSGLALLVLVLYFHILLGFGGDLIAELRSVVPLLDARHSNR
jgi:type III secretion protein T